MIYSIELQKKRKISGENCHKRVVPLINGKSVIFFAFANLSLQMLMMIQTFLCADPDIEGQWHRAPGWKTKIHPIGQNGATKSKMNSKEKKESLSQRVIHFLHFFPSILYNDLFLMWPLQDCVLLEKITPVSILKHIAQVFLCSFQHLRKYR